jgi:cytoplasmic iron level regulating protein YaaA (DUF328/UPF0246 family)
VRRFLLIGCSQKKNNAAGGIPAIERYQGVVYRVIRKAKREGYWPTNVDIYIVSARYGLIAASYPIEFYDQKMTSARALELQSEVSQALDTLLSEGKYEEIFINMGKPYMQCIEASSEIRNACKIGLLREATGSIGLRQKQTKEWIREQYYLDM